MTFSAYDNSSGIRWGLFTDPDMVVVPVNPDGSILIPHGGTTGAAVQTVNNGTGASSTGSVGAASALIKAANTHATWLTIQNTHATQDLFLSFTNPATTSDLKIAAGSSITWNNPPTNAVYGIGSGAATTFAIMEITAP